MKKLIILIIVALALGACATTKETLPFYDSKKYGKNPTLRCKNHDRQKAWVYRQWGHEGR